MPSERWTDKLLLVRIDFGVEIAISRRGENGPHGKDIGGRISSEASYTATVFLSKT